MTKKIRVWFLLLLIMVISVGIYIFAPSLFDKSHLTKEGYELYEQGQYQAAFNKFNQNANSDPQSAYALAMMYKTGIGTNNNQQKALDWLIQSADSGNKNALYNLGFYRYNRDIADTPEDQYGIVSLSKAADMNVMDAQVMLGGIYLSDQYDDVPQNIDLARKYFTLAAAQDSLLAKFALGYIAHSVDNDNKKAIELLTPLASKEFPLPAMLLVEIYQEGGNGINANPFLASQYEKMVMSNAFSFISSAEQSFEPAPLSLYGVQTEAEKRQLLDKLKTRAINGEQHAIYTLATRYLNGEGVTQSNARALFYLRPLIEQREPKALYLKYTINKDDIQDLIDAAEGGYLDAAYLLYQIYSRESYEYDEPTNDKLAEKYLTLAADSGHEQALLKIINNAYDNYYFPSKKLNNIIVQYTPILLEKYPNSINALLLSSRIYGDKNSALYSPEKSFELIEKANQLSPSTHNTVLLAQKYAYGFGTEQNLAKAVAILKKIIDKDIDESLASRTLVQLYYQYDLKGFIDEDYIIKLLKYDVIEQENNQLAYLYADYLLQQDPIKNLEQAFKLYQQTKDDDYNAHLHYANALLTYKTDQEKLAADIALKLLKVSPYEEPLTEPQRNQANVIILKTAMTNTATKEQLVFLALDNHPEAIKQLTPLIGNDADITYFYGMGKLKLIKHFDTASDEELKPYFDLILKASELNSQHAIFYIIENLDSVNYHNSKPYNKARFQKLTGLAPTDLITYYQKCADLGNDRCLYDLGEIYQNGQHGVDANYDTALSYYNKISDPSFSFLKWRLEEITKGKVLFADISQKAQQGDADALYKLAIAYKKGNYGQKIDHNKWLKYLEASAKLNDTNALTSLIDYYSQDSLIDDNKTKILGYYQQLTTTDDQEYARELADQYLQGSRLVEPDREKARQFYIKAGDRAKSDLKSMSNFDRNIKLAEHSVKAKMEVGEAYLYGRGVKKDVVKANEYFKKSSEDGDENAIDTYAEMLYMGVYDKENKKWISEPNWNEAIVWLRKIPNQNRAKQSIAIYETIVKPAIEGSPDAFIQLADWYKNKSQYEAASLWYQKAIDNGQLEAIYQLDEITKDPQAKQQLYRLGVEKGDDYSKIQQAKQDLNNPQITMDSEQYQNTLQNLNDGLKSSRPLVSQQAFDILSDFYQFGIKNDNGEIIRPPQIETYRQLLENESASRNQALRQLYRFYLKTDPEKALSYLQMAYNRNDIDAIYQLYQHYVPDEYCSNDNADIDKSAQYLTEWLEKNHFDQQNTYYYIDQATSHSKKMGDLYRKESCDLPVDLNKALAWYKTSLKYDESYALDALYESYLGQDNAKEAYYYALVLEKSVGDIELFNQLSAEDKQQIEQRYAKEQDYKKYGQYAEEIENQRIKAEAGDRFAALSLAVSYARGERVPEDTQKMLYYYELAGKHGLSRAYNVLGGLYRDGKNERGIDKNPEKALYYYQLGAQQNDSNTAHLAGDMYYFGQGIDQNYTLAAKYYDMTDLEQGTHHAMAKYKLAYMYYTGLVGNKSKQDIQKAYDYLQLGAKYEDQDSINALTKWNFSQLKAN